MTFKSFHLNPQILQALVEAKYEEPTPIQTQAIPVVLEGRDLLASAQTGTGKTAAFAIPILEQIERAKGKEKTHRKLRALVVTPTRELALQVCENFQMYSKHLRIRSAVIFGGVSQHKQTRQLERGVDVLVATPGRLIDLMEQGYVKLNEIEHVVLDEADHMLDMGFIAAMKRIIKALPKKRQSLFFSATLPKDIIELAHGFLNNPEEIRIQPTQTTAERVKQAAYMVNKEDKRSLLLHVLKEEHQFRVLIFARTKYGCDKLAKFLRNNDFRASAIHGDKSQNQRQRILNDFKDGRLHILIATDVAARGIDISELPLVINFNVPNVPETYVHRIGRTGRASADGIAISFVDVDERHFLWGVEKLIGNEVPRVENHPFVDEREDPRREPKKKRRAPKRGSGRGRKPSHSSKRDSGGAKGKGKGEASKGPRQKSEGRSSRDDSNPGSQRRRANSRPESRSGSRSGEGNQKRGEQRSSRGRSGQKPRSSRPSENSKRSGPRRRK